MINVTIYMDSLNNPTGFEVIGHAGYARTGKDIICAAVSALVITTSNAIERFTKDAFEGYEDEKTGRISFMVSGNISKESKLLINSMILGLTDIENEYGNKYLKISYKEV